MLNIDIVVSDKTLLLSRKSMKETDMKSDFKSNQTVIFDELT